MSFIKLRNKIFDPASKFDVTYVESGSDDVSQTDKDNVLKYIDMLTDRLTNAADESKELYDTQDFVAELLNQFYNGEMTAGKKSTFYKSLVENKLAKLKALLNERTGRDTNDESLWHNEYEYDSDGNTYDAPIGLDLNDGLSDKSSNIDVSDIAKAIVANDLGRSV